MHCATARLDAEEGTRQHLAMEMELVLTFYCKTRNVPYTEDCGWAELLLPFVSLGLSRRDLFNAFYALTVKYLPRFVCWLLLWLLLWFIIVVVLLWLLV